MKKKKIILVAILGLLVIVFLLYKNNKVEQTPRKMEIVKHFETFQDSLIQPLAFLHQFFTGGEKDPKIGREIERFLNAYDSIKSDFSYLDSISGLSIDFIGILHNDFSSDDKKTFKSQDSLKKLIALNNWDIIGYESSSKFDFLNRNDLLHEAREEMSIYGIEIDAEKCLSLNGEGDIIQQYIENGAKNIIGTENVETWRLQQKIRFLAIATNDTFYKGIMEKTNLALNEVRSGVALSRTARMMKKHGKKNGVVIYGMNHLKDFIWLQSKFKTNSKFFKT